MSNWIKATCRLLRNFLDGQWNHWDFVVATGLGQPQQQRNTNAQCWAYVYREKPSRRAKVTLLQREMPVGNQFDFDSLRRESSNLPHPGCKILEVVFLHKNDVIEFEKKFHRFQIHDATVRKTAVRRRKKVDRPSVVPFTQPTDRVEVVASSLHSADHSLPSCTKHIFQAPMHRGAEQEIISVNSLCPHKASESHQKLTAIFHSTDSLITFALKSYKNCALEQRG